MLFSFRATWKKHSTYWTTYLPDRYFHKEIKRIFKRTNFFFSSSIDSFKGIGCLFFTGVQRILLGSLNFGIPSTRFSIVRKSDFYRFLSNFEIMKVKIKLKVKFGEERKKGKNNGS